MSRVVVLSAPAKLNLALSVGPPERGPDDRGTLHPICSWMVTVSLCDELEVTRLPDDRLSRYAILWHEEALRPGEIDWSITRDLAVRAHRALEQHVGRPLPIQLKLEKRIPVGGGLGGGSADAAAMLHAVNALFDLGLDEDALGRIGATLGSDIPFLVHGGSGLVGGFGETLELHPGPPELHAVVVLPDATCPTGEVYDTYDDLGPRALREAEVRAIVAAGDLAEILFNDLAEAALAVTPEIAPVRDAVTRLAERTVHVTGSGAALFVVCDDPLHAEHLAEAIGREHDLPAVAVTAAAGARAVVEEVS